MEETYITYRIIDPRDGVPVYVGQSGCFEKRKLSHLRRASKSLPKTKTFDIKVFLVLLKSEGFDPIFEVVDEQSSEENSIESELLWVKLTVDAGYPVLNRWNGHRKLVKARFSSEQFKKYFCNKFPDNKVLEYLPK